MKRNLVAMVDGNRSRIAEETLNYRFKLLLHMQPTNDTAVSKINRRGVLFLLVMQNARQELQWKPWHGMLR